VLEPTDAIDIAATRTTTVSSKLHLAGDADVIVSGDQNLLTLKGAGKVRIVAPREFRPGSAGADRIVAVVWVLVAVAVVAWPNITLRTLAWLVGGGWWSPGSVTSSEDFEGRPMSASRRSCVGWPARSWGSSPWRGRT
jgi:hypothetical protein